MSASPNQPTDSVDAAQFRFQSLIAHVESIQAGICDYPGASNLKKLTSNYLTMANALFPLFTQALEKEQDQNIMRSAKHRMVDKLAREWEIIYQLIANAKLLGSYLSTTNDFSWLDELTRLAQKDLNYSNRDFIIVPRLTQRYALTQFRYAPGFSALDIPVSALNAAWEWSILWHELAGRKIRDLNAANRSSFTIESVTAVEAARQKDAQDLLDELMIKLQKDQAVGSVLLRQIRTLLKMPSPPNWSRDWVEELFEDSCSVLTFGEDFIPVLESILSQPSIQVDRRHPSPAVRLRVARRLLNLGAQAENDQFEKIEQDVVAAIKELITVNDLRLPVLFPDQRNEIHTELQSIMRRFASSTASSAETEALKLRLNDMLSTKPQTIRKDLEHPPVDLTVWGEIASQDYKQMLSIRLSESDEFGATTHSSADHSQSGNVLGGLTVYYYDSNGTVHSHYHTY